MTNIQGNKLRKS